jgi:quaternary ammonium compound-resistance protein SugE
MAWMWLLAAGGFEVGFATALARSDGFAHLAAGVVSVVLGVLAVAALSQAMRSLPASVGYAVFTGIGTVGVTAVDLASGEKLGLPTGVALALIVVGVGLLRVVGAR